MGCAGRSSGSNPGISMVPFGRELEHEPVLKTQKLADGQIDAPLGDPARISVPTEWGGTGWTSRTRPTAPPRATSSPPAGMSTRPRRDARRAGDRPRQVRISHRRHGQAHDLATLCRRERSCGRHRPGAVAQAGRGPGVGWGGRHPGDARGSALAAMSRWSTSGLGTMATRGCRTARSASNG